MIRKFVPHINNPETEENLLCIEDLLLFVAKKFPIVSSCFSGVV